MRRRGGRSPEAGSGDMTGDGTSRAGGISIHAVDVANGVPAAGLGVRLFRTGADEREIAAGRCGADGHFRHPASQGEGVVRGTYRAEFDVGDYYRARGAPLPSPAFLDVAAFAFGIGNVAEHFHLPLKFTPWGYSLFRGGA